MSPPEPRIPCPQQESKARAPAARGEPHLLQLEESLCLHAHIGPKTKVDNGKSASWRSFENDPGDNGFMLMQVVNEVMHPLQQGEAPAPNGSRLISGV